MPLKKTSIRRGLQWILILILLLSCWLWWRTGSIEVVLDQESLKIHPVTDGPVTFSIMTYNVQARPWFDDSKHTFHYLSPLLNKYDICAVQECFKDHNRLWNEAEHPVKIYHATLKHPLKVVGSGLSILGKYPLEKTTGINFAHQGDKQNLPASKGVLMARFKIQDMLLDVYTTHIAAGKHTASLEARIAQGNEIIQFIQTNSPPENAVILLGDFNMRPSRGTKDKEANKDNPRVYGFDRIVDALKLRDASDEINGPIGKEIDRILFRPGKNQTLQPLDWEHDAPEFYDPDGKALSDHEPVIVNFKLTKEPTG
ncbi:MAG: endonuclease/exonuclease/phosphatase family protein [Candidatus Hydrogenedentes bacterium]|nr:endonuclease/exonuclease/phosphatase family protein [Candidatus Hydrogenedentota bacterium]